MIAPERRLELAAIAINANFVVVAEVVAPTAVARIGLGMNASVIALLGAHGAVNDANAVLAARGIARTNIAYHAAILGIGHQVRTHTIDHG